MRVFLDEINFGWVHWVKQIALPNVGGPHPIGWQLDYKRERRKNSCSLLTVPAGTSIFSSLQTQTETGAYTMGPPGSQAFRLRLELNTLSSPASPGDQLQILDFPASIFMSANSLKGMHVVYLLFCFLWWAQNNAVFLKVLTHFTNVSDVNADYPHTSGEAFSLRTPEFRE